MKGVPERPVKGVQKACGTMADDARRIVPACPGVLRVECFESAFDPDRGALQRNA